MKMIPNPLNLKDRVVVITGAASGIGRGAAHQIAAQGAETVLVDRNEAGLQETLKEIEELGGKGSIWPLDISKPVDVEATFQAIGTRFGTIHAVVANAGINGLWGPIEELTEEEFDRTVGVNLKGTLFTIKSATPFLKKQGGAIVVTSSINGTRVFDGGGMTVYATTKGGQAVMAKMLAHELGPFGIRVNIVAPGGVSTNIGDSTEWRGEYPVGRPKRFPAGKIPLTGWEPATADQIGQAILFLVSDASLHISGTELYVDGGESLV